VMEKIIMQMWMRREPSTRTLSAYFWAGKVGNGTTQIRRDVFVQAMICKKCDGCWIPISWKFLIIKTSDRAQPWSRWSNGSWRCLRARTRIRKNTAYQQIPAQLKAFEKWCMVRASIAQFLSRNGSDLLDGWETLRTTPIIGPTAMWYVNVVHHWQWITSTVQTFSISKVKHSS
jgi:hypothetical protein